MAKKEKSKLRELIEEYGIKDLNDVHEFVKEHTAETNQEVVVSIFFGTFLKVKLVPQLELAT